MQRALLGGTFDPPHIAHLIAAESAYRDLDLDIVTFLPAGAPWQKLHREVSSPADRWAMTKLAVDGVEYFDADDREVVREGWTYTIETIESFDDEVTLILGADAAARLPTWHRSADVLERAQLAVMERPGTSRSDVEAVLDQPVNWLDAPLVDLSATMIRERAASGQSVRFLVPDAVYSYIEEHRLYG